MENLLARVVGGGAVGCSRQKEGVHKNIRGDARKKKRRTFQKKNWGFLKTRAAVRGKRAFLQLHTEQRQRATGNVWTHRALVVETAKKIPHYEKVPN